MTLYLGNNLISGVTTPTEPTRNLGQIIESILPLTDAGLHLLDGALIQGDGIYSAFVDYITELYDTVSVSGYKANIVKVGSLTEIDGVINGFSSNSYAKTNVTLNFGSANTWEIVTKQNISSVSSINDGYMGVLGGAFNVNYYITTANKVTVELSSDGTSYNIGSIGMLSAIPLNTDFYLKTEFTGTAYNLYYSTDGETWTLQGSISSSTKVSSRTNNFAFGVDEAGSHASWVGSFDLKGCYINTNGVRLWTGAEEIKPCFCTEAQWQSSVTTYGVCGKFVYDSVNNTVRLPKYGTQIFTKTPSVASTVPVRGNGITLGLTNGSGLYGLSEVAANVQSISAYGSNYGTSVGHSSGGTGTFPGTSGRAFGVTTDATKSGIIAVTSSLLTDYPLDCYYYIVIATTTKTEIEVDIDEVVTDLNGKADVDFTNVTNVANVKMAKASMPSNTSITLTLGASGTTYTMPADGWLMLSLHNPNNTYSYLNNATSHTLIGGFIAGGITEQRMMSVKKNDVITIYYGAIDNQDKLLKFFYAVGSEV